MTEHILPTEMLQRLSRRNGVDTRPVLVRVLTDLFIQQPNHAPDEVARFEELVSGLLDVVDVDARAAVSRKLADEPRTPRSLIERLIADDASVSAPILARFAAVPRDTLLAVALDGGPIEAAAVAARSDIDDEMVRTLAHHTDELVLETLAANPAAKLREASLAVLVGRAVSSPALAAAVLRREDIDDAALAPLYGRAEPPRRAAIREAMAARPGRLSSAARGARTPDTLDEALVEAATATGRAEAIAEALADQLSLRPDEAARLATEPSGEPFVMMMRAAGVSNELIVRAMLVAQPAIAQSVPRFFNLVEIAETTPRSVAAELVRSLAGRPAKTAAARHEPMFEPLGALERTGAARTTAVRRPVARPETSRQRG